ncbi:MAG: S41 family peptidase [Spirochaetes bacterium]|jgi:carboxyl-terminal processing protease|nr:S41 family peptidase [Spirochaetota bacterium]
MFRKIKERSLHLLILAFLTGLFLGINISFVASANEPAHKYLDYFHQVYQLIRTEYVDEPPTREIFFGAIKGMIKALDDPFSRFLDESAYNELKEITTGKFVGVGVEITEKDDEIVVITPIAESPAMNAGINAGDVIARVNDTPIKGKKMTDVIKLIKGIPGSRVKLSIKREGFARLIDFDIERAPIKIKSVEYTIIKEPGIGYLRIISFGSDTTRDVIKGLELFNENKIGKIIIDLRFNPGGLLESSVEISELFLKKGSLVVSTRGREGKVNVKEFKSAIDPIYNGEVVVLVNGGSASAAEILSGAIRDNKRGKLVGEKTFGKGSVQKTYNLDENIAVAITIAKYYTPSGELIHKKGITPDHVVAVEKMTEADMRNLRNMDRGKLLDKFVKEGTEYNEQTRKAFRDFLAAGKIKLSEKTADFVLKNRIMKFRKKPPYDLEFDNQLVYAVKLLGGK